VLVCEREELLQILPIGSSSLGSAVTEEFVEQVFNMLLFGVDLGMGCFSSRTFLSNLLQAVASSLSWRSVDLGGSRGRLNC